MDKNRHLISKYLEGELDSGEVARFEEALLEDHELREELELYREVDEALADTEVMELRAQLDELHEELVPQLEKAKIHQTGTPLRGCCIGGRCHQPGNVQPVL